ncbi:MAG: respiratory nitrate reductase subunit gamma [Thaumarchaeota archaeon]|nr:respiratory nitrate reductase subunit gamma [Nitrososphaerota archaeon]
MPLDSQAGSGTFPSFVSVSLIDVAAGVILVVVLVILAVKFLKPSPSTTRLLSRGRRKLGAGGLLKIFLSELVSRVVLQKDIINERSRRFAHLCMFWGFVGLSATTTADYLLNRPGNYIPLLGGGLSWIRILGNFSGAVMILGALVAVTRLFGVRKFRERITFSDAWFAILLLLVGITGFLAEYLGDLAHSVAPNIPPAAQFTISTSANMLIVIPYGLHLVLITLLFVSAPLSAFMHAFRVPSLRYMDRVGDMLARKKRSGGISTDETSEPYAQNLHRSIKEEVMIDQIKSHYEAAASSEDEPKSDRADETK